MARRRVKRGDTKRRIWQLRQKGDVVPLTGVTEVRMLAALAPGQAATGTTTLSAVCEVVDAAQGKVKEPVGGLGALALALYKVEFQVTFTGGEVETIPDEEWELVEVIPDLNPPP